MLRSDLIAELARMVMAIRRDHPVRAAIDGVDGAGKTILADELASVLQSCAKSVIRTSVDGFHFPKSRRYRRGTDSPEGFYLDSFDYDALKSSLLEPLGPDGNRRYRTAVFDWRSDSAVNEPARPAPDDAILLFDGIFAQRPELEGCWDFVIFFGFSDLSTARHVGSETRFRIASVTKAFTAEAVIAALKSRGQTVSARIRGTPNCPGGYGNVRYRDLLDNLVSYGSIKDYDGVTPITRPRGRLRALCGQARHANQFAYRNDNYLVLSDLLHALTGVTFEKSVSRLVFEPTRMRSASFAMRKSDAVGYRCSAHPRRIADMAQGTKGAGGMISDADDILRWDRTVLNGTALSSLNGSYTGKLAGLSFVDGLVLERQYGDMVFVTAGRSPGFSSLNIIYPKENRALVILTNCDRLDGLQSLAALLHDMLF